LAEELFKAATCQHVEISVGVFLLEQLYAMLKVHIMGMVTSGFMQNY
jgi:hypothetical protein